MEPVGEPVSADKIAIAAYQGFFAYAGWWAWPSFGTDYGNTGIHHCSVASVYIFAVTVTCLQIFNPPVLSCLALIQKQHKNWKLSEVPRPNPHPASQKSVGMVASGCDIEMWYRSTRTSRDQGGCERLVLSNMRGWIELGLGHFNAMPNSPV